jgi:hypothetical protein
MAEIFAQMNVPPKHCQTTTTTTTKTIEENV